MISRNKAKKAFDKALKLSKDGKLTDVYVMGDGRKYEAYCTNKQWAKYLKDMEDNYNTAHGQFEKGDGAELMEKKAWSGKMMPPKMASYASSSRFIYEESRNLRDAFEFECKLPIAFSGYRGEAKASLDGYIMSKRIFVEAKCHEFYYRPSTEFKSAYESFYEYLKDKTGGLFDYYTIKGNKKDYVRFKWDGKTIESLDLKQLLCHMLGIAKKALQEDCSEVSTLLYLVYKPEEKMLRFVPTEEERSGIIKYWEIEKKEANNVDFPLLYGHIVRFIHDEKKDWQKERKYSDRVDEIASAFQFEFCDQNRYREIISSVK